MTIPLSQSETINIKTLHHSYAALLDAHSHLLARKNVRSKQRLLQIIKMDLDKLTHALLEVQSRRAWSVLNHFFADHKTMLSPIAECLERDTIDHMGFEIHEPLDLVLYGLNHWMTKTRRAFHCSLQIHDVLRFPASDAFQRRVGSYTEIMRLWVQVNEQTLMLELFDIHRPVDEFLAGDPPKALIHRNFDCLVTHTGIPGEDTRPVAALFRGDAIWHYAFQVRHRDDVMQLHAGLQRLAERDPTYVLPYAAPVRNAGDNSLHTKIIHQRAGLELEFVTRYAGEL